MKTYHVRYKCRICQLGYDVKHDGEDSPELMTLKPIQHECSATRVGIADPLGITIKEDD